MTDDDLHARFDKVTSGEELAELRTRQTESRGLLHRAGQLLLAAAAVAGVLAVVWVLVHIAVWFGNHGMLPAPN